MASVYALRLFIRAMHNRIGSRVDAREITVRDGLVLVPLLAVIVFMALYPQLALHRSEGSVKAAVAPAHDALSPVGPGAVASATATGQAVRVSGTVGVGK
jgi:NADH:ubiquinone oxidoreductase subunit 4 (subunit M)